MNEATASIVNTIVTVTGIILAFITALVAEPLKNNFENKSKIKRLRLALYKELLYNYLMLRDAVIDPNKDSTSPLQLQSLLRIECYKDVLSNNVALFYQLKDATEINYLYSMLNFIDIKIKHMDEHVASNLWSDCELFTNLFEIKVYCSFDADVLRKLMLKEQYEDLIKKGKKLSKEGIKNSIHQEQSSPDNVDVQSS